jgi:hypothetical protein
MLNIDRDRPHMPLGYNLSIEDEADYCRQRVAQTVRRTCAFNLTSLFDIQDRSFSN